MSSRYAMHIDVSLGHFIRGRIETFFAGEGFRKVLDLTTPDGPDIMEFKRGDHFVSMTFSEHQAGTADLVLESHAPQADALFVKAVHWIATDLLVSFIQGLPGCKREILDHEVQESLDELFARVNVCPA